eukprot:m.269125 g.269125  ORF g.269125 m.269125 type:complete len:455 (+) comp19734_c0_seq58:6454-7818(+)
MRTNVQRMHASVQTHTHPDTYTLTNTSTARRSHITSLQNNDNMHCHSLPCFVHVTMQDQVAGATTLTITAHPRIVVIIGADRPHRALSTNGQEILIHTVVRFLQSPPLASPHKVLILVERFLVRPKSATKPCSILPAILVSFAAKHWLPVQLVDKLLSGQRLDLLQGLPAASPTDFVGGNKRERIMHQHAVSEAFERIPALALPHEEHVLLFDPQVPGDTLPVLFPPCVNLRRSGQGEKRVRNLDKHDGNAGTHAPCQLLDQRVRLTEGLGACLFDGVPKHFIFQPQLTQVVLDLLTLFQGVLVATQLFALVETRRQSRKRLQQHHQLLRQRVDFVVDGEDGRWHAHTRPASVQKRIVLGDDDGLVVNFVAARHTTPDGRLSQRGRGIAVSCCPIAGHFVLTPTYSGNANSLECFYHFQCSSGGQALTAGGAHHPSANSAMMQLLTRSKHRLEA